jgi:hypothetical protein
LHNSNNNNNSNFSSGSAARKTFEVKFSAFEFLAASARLSPVNIDGLETFVAAMLEKAIAGRQVLVSDKLECLYILSKDIQS